MLQTVTTSDVLQFHLSVCYEPETVSQIRPLLEKSFMVMSCDVIKHEFQRQIMYEADVCQMLENI